MLRLIAFLLLALFLHAASKAEPIVVGLHLYTYHVPQEFECKACSVSNDTPGVYVVVQGFTAGVVRNSYRRWSVYAGKVWAVDEFDFTLGVITGYKYHRVHGPETCPNRIPMEDRANAHCSAKTGTTNAVLRPLVAVSYALPLRQYIGVTPRVSMLGKGLHLSVEHGF